jgi:hypothetical protein
LARSARRCSRWLSSICSHPAAPAMHSSRLASYQGLTLVHFSAQLEPCLTHKNTLHTLHTP